MGSNGRVIAFSKGAPEKILEISSQIEINGETQVIDQNYKEMILTMVNDQANQGFRTLAIAYKDIIKIDDLKREDVETDLIFLGFVSIMDPPRPEVKKAVEECQSGGIKVIMITGDHPSTAKTIATQMGIYREGDLVATGNQIENIYRFG